MSRLLPYLVMLCLAPSSTSAQQIVGVSVGGVVPATGRSTIRGRVLSSDDGQPILQATVFIISTPDRRGRWELTDADGRYEFRDLPAGRYSINASKPTFVNWAYGQTQPNGSGTPLALADNQAADNIDIRLPRGAVITGRVTDESGEPVPNDGINSLVPGHACPRPGRPGGRDLRGVGGRTRFHAARNREREQSPAVPLGTPRSARGW